MTQGQINKEESDVQKSSLEKKKDKDHTPAKVVIRRLPPTLTPEEFVQQVAPLPEYDFFYFVRADMSLGANAFTRAYIHFLVPDDIFIFRDKFDGYVFLDAKGGEYPAIVEFAPFQKVPKKKPKKVDTKNGIIEQDSDYKKFLEILTKPPDAVPVSLDAMVVEVEAKENSLAKSGSSKVSTPLLDYLRKRREERKLNIAKLKEERRRIGGRDRDIDRKRPVKDDLDRRKSSEKERLRDRDRDRRRDRDRDRDRIRDRPREIDRRRIKDSPRSERIKDDKDVETKWQRETEGKPKQFTRLLRNTERDKASFDKESGDKTSSALEKDEDTDDTVERLSETDQGKIDRKAEDSRGKNIGGKWLDDRRRDDDRHGSRGRGIGGEERGKYSKDYGSRSYREDEDSHRLDKRDRHGSERYSDRGYGSKVRDDRGMGGARDKYREDRGGGIARMRDRDDRRGGAERDDRRSGGDREDRRMGYGEDRRDGGYRDDRRGGGDRDDRRGDRRGERDDRRRVESYRDREDRKIGGGDGWKKKDVEGGDSWKKKDIESGDGWKKKDVEGGDSWKKKDIEGGDSWKKKDIEGGDGWKKKDVEGGDSWKKKDIEFKKAEKPIEKKSETVKSKSGEEGKKEGTASSMKESQSQDLTKEDRGKDRPERQIYIPRKALEKQRQSSPQTGESSRDKPNS
ncbi:regulator of nonsense transcripts 3B-like isoform X2 [Physella acuta]|uniref:regulator of nonsense transcripts 3B-like isoform X2 n=1 Tax=Physella acuta TaxID=109671 RepID=UPI0027DD7D84|nr:regulator of nonsense transcripts 3B-like isoform X2 [Physella acuta]